MAKLNSKQMPKNSLYIHQFLETLHMTKQQKYESLISLLDFWGSSIKFENIAYIFRKQVFIWVMQKIGNPVIDVFSFKKGKDSSKQMVTFNTPQCDTEQNSYPRVVNPHHKKNWRGI